MLSAIKSVSKAVKRTLRGKKPSGTTDGSSMSQGSFSPRSSVRGDETPRHSIDSIRPVGMGIPNDQEIEVWSAKATDGIKFSTRSGNGPVSRIALPPLSAIKTNPDSISARALMSPALTRPPSSRDVLSLQGPASFRGVVSPPPGSARVSQSPGPWPPHSGQESLQPVDGNKTQEPVAKDNLRPEPTGVKLTFKQNGKDEEIQAAQLQILAEKNVLPVVQEDCPALAFHLNRENTYAALKEKRLFSTGKRALWMTQIPSTTPKKNA